ncbi:hypothetical protein OIO90_005062 [Microbotryomycetes sp. JL221]|nr:hypothetical protein OIO90_005062 [Microbotryomycetes sp. JL221]
MSFAAIGAATLRLTAAAPVAASDTQAVVQTGDTAVEVHAVLQQAQLPPGDAEEDDEDDENDSAPLEKRKNKSKGKKKNKGKKNNKGKKKGKGKGKGKGKKKGKGKGKGKPNYNLSSKQMYSGQATWYEQHGNYGSCGWKSNDGDKVVAVNTPQVANQGHCGQWVIIQNASNGKQIKAKVADECPTCSWGSLDLSVGAFKETRIVEANV